MSELPREGFVNTRATAAVAGAVLLVLLVPATALGAAPGATTSPATAVTSTSASLNGTVSPNKENTSYHFDYGLTAGYGVNAAQRDRERQRQQKRHRRRDGARTLDDLPLPPGRVEPVR